MVKKDKELWSADVETKWHPPEGFFEQSAEKKDGAVSINLYI